MREEAAARVRAFIDARDEWQRRRGYGPTYTVLEPDRILASYGALDMNDLRLLVEDE